MLGTLEIIQANVFLKVIVSALLVITKLLEDFMRLIRFPKKCNFKKVLIGGKHITPCIFGWREWHYERTLMSMAGMRTHA